MNPRSKIALSVLGVVLGLAVLVLIAIWHLKATYWKVARATGEPIPVQVVQVTSGTVAEALSSEGTAREYEMVPLSTLTAGTVKKVGVRLGDLVKSGERVAELDLTPLQSTLRMAQALLRTERQQYLIYAEKAAIMKELFDKQLVAQDELNNALLAALNAEESVAQREDAVVQAQVNLDSAVVRSPVSGIVTQRDVYEGSVTKPQTPILTVAQIDPVLIHAPFAENRIRSLYLGQPARVSLYAFPGEKFAGKVQWINPVVDNTTRLMSVHVAVSNSDLRIKPGMRGIVWLDNTRTGAVRVPAIALVSASENSAYVFVVDDGSVAHIRKIATGAYAEGYMEVKEGLAPGERVVVVGQVGLRDKDKVRVFDK